MADDRYFTGAGPAQSSSPTPFAGRSARGYASGSTTVFVGNNTTPRRAPSDTGSYGHSVAAAGAAGVYGTPSAAKNRQYVPHESEPRQARPAQAQSPAARTDATRSASPITEYAAQTRPTPQPARRAEASANSRSANGGASAKTSGASTRPTRPSGSGTQPKKTEPTPKEKGKKGKNADPADGAAPKKKHKGIAVFLSVLLALIILIAGTGAGACAYVLKDYKNDTLSANAYVSEDKLKSSSRVTNILLMGIDTESTSSSTRSDAMVMISIDSAHKKIKLTSFLRDMYVTVPGHGETKLTHACSYKDGGPQLTCDTIELNFGVNIDGFAKIGYDIFKKVIDAVGGITVAEIDKTEAKAMAEENVILEPGTNIHLDGKQALVYCRIRHGQSDFQRTERQRETIMLVLNKMKKMNPAKLLKLASSVASEIDCSVPKSELMKIAFKALPCLFGSVEQTQIPTDGAWSYGTRDGLSVVLVNFEKNREFLSNWIYGE